MKISEQDLRAVNRSSIPLGVGGGYYGEMAVFHELHCLVLGAHSLEVILVLTTDRNLSDKRFIWITMATILGKGKRRPWVSIQVRPDIANIEWWLTRSLGPEHCIEILRQSVMCRGDTTLITFRWGHTVKLPQPDFTLEHTCVDWDSLMGWAGQHAINVFDEGMLVHPTLGNTRRRCKANRTLTADQVHHIPEVIETTALAPSRRTTQPEFLHGKCLVYQVFDRSRIFVGFYMPCGFRQ